MSTNRRFALLPLVAFTLLVGGSCWAQVADFDPADRLQDPPVNDKTKPYVDCLKKMIGVFNNIGNEAGPMQQPAKNAAAALGSVLKDGRGYLENMDGGTEAAATQDKNNAKTKILVIDPRLRVFIKCDPCHPDFLLLMATLVHEAVHVGGGAGGVPGQDLNTEFPKSLEEKLKKLENECPAYETGLSFRQALRNAVEQLQAERRGVSGAKPPAWLKDLVKDCPDIDQTLFDLRKGINSAIDNDNIRLEQLGNYLTKCLRDKKKLAKECESEVPEKQFECLDKDERVKHFFTPVPEDGPEAVFTLNAKGGTFLIDGEELASGIALPQDAHVFEDVSSRIWLLVAGNAGGDGPGGVKLHRLERQDGRVLSVELQTVADPQGFLEFVTGVARRDDGRFFAFDFKKAAIHELQDTTGDGLPDVVGPSAGVLPPPDDARHFCAIHATGNQLVLQIRAIDPLYGNSPRLVLTDAAGDGSYESFQFIHPSQFPSLPPCWLGTMVQGMTEVGVAGGHGHPFVIVSLQNPNQPLGQGQFPAFPQREILVQLARPLQLGEELIVRDLANNQSTPSGQVEARRAVLHQTLPIRVRPKQEAEVTLRGAGFEDVAKVRIGDKTAAILSSSATQLVVRTAKLKRTERYEIEFEMQDGSLRKGELALFPDLSDE